MTIDGNRCLVKGPRATRAESESRRLASESWLIPGAVSVLVLREVIAMVLLEMSVVPVGTGTSLSSYVARCVDIVDQSGLDYELHSMGTVVEGDLAGVLTLLQRCIEELARDNDRVACTAKLDYRKGVSGQLQAKVSSVEQQLGRSLKK